MLFIEIKIYFNTTVKKQDHQTYKYNLMCFSEILIIDDVSYELNYSNFSVYIVILSIKLTHQL